MSVTSLPTSAAFNTLNQAYNRVFRPNRLSVGLVVPVEHYESSPVPLMQRHLERVKMAESMGFSSIWLRDVPFHVPTFGDAGQPFDPFVYLGYLAAHTSEIALGVASVVLPLRHPAHVAKAAASVDALSGGRLLLGVASGDRPEEYPAMNLTYTDRGGRFRDSLAYLRDVGQNWPKHESSYGNLRGNLDLLPKPTASRLPLLVTGGSQQPLDWIASHADGWIQYPRNAEQQANVVAQWHEAVESAGRASQPVMQPLYIDLLENEHAPPQPLNLGFRAGIRHVISHLKKLEQVGVNHIALNLRFNRADTERTLNVLAEQLLPAFSD